MRTFIRSPRRHLAGLGIAGLLTASLACGGGGGSSTPAPAPTPSSTPVAGRSAKGIIQNGVVTAYEWSGTSWAQRGTTTTNSQGDYTLNLSGYSGQALKLVISATGTTTMLWDGPDGGGHTFGKAEAVPSSFSMQAVLPTLPAAGLTNIPITPYTSMAAAMVEAASIKDAATVQKAISTINVMTGFDVAHTKVLDITSPTAMSGASTLEQRASAMTAALAFVPGQAVSDLVTKLSQSSSDGKFDGSDPIGITLLTKAWTDAAADSHIASGLSDSAKNDIQVAAATVNAAASTGTYTPIPPVNPPTSDIAAAKGLIGDARSLITNIVQTDFKTPIGAVSSKAEAAASVFERDTAAMAQILEISIQQALTQVGTAEEIRDAVLKNGSVEKALTIKEGANSLGTLTLKVSNASSVKIGLTGALKGTSSNARTVTVNVSIDTGMDLGKIDWSKLTTTQTSTQIALQASVGDGTTSLGISNGTISATVTPASGGNPVLTALSLKDLTLDLKTEKASFTGSASLEGKSILDAANMSAYFHVNDRLSLKTASLSGTFALGSGETFKASLGLDLANADTFDVLAFLNSDDTLSLWADDVLTDAQIQALKNAAGLTNVTGNWSISCAVDPVWNRSYAYVYDGRNSIQVDPAKLMAAYNPDSYFLGQFKANAGATIMGRGVFVGRYNGTTTSFIRADLRLPQFQETADHFLQLSTTMNFELTGITGLPTAKVAVAAKRSALNGGSATIGVTWGTSQYTFTFSDIDVVAKTGSVTIANGQGVSLTLKDINSGDATGALYVGTVKVADVKEVKSGIIKVSYMDGTFETLQ